MCEKEYCISLKSKIRTYQDNAAKKQFRKPRAHNMGMSIQCVSTVLVYKCAKHLWLPILWSFFGFEKVYMLLFSFASVHMNHFYPFIIYRVHTSYLLKVLAHKKVYVYVEATWRGLLVQGGGRGRLI